MRQAAWLAIWEWSPGVLAGGLPLLVFLLASRFGSEFEVINNHERGLVSHLLVMAIVTASVSAITSFGRILNGKIPNILRDGRAPILLIILLVATIVYSTALYGMLEVGAVKHPEDGMKLMASWGLLASLVSSLYMEFAIARLHVLSKTRRARAPNGRGVQANESASPSVRTPGEY